MTARELYDTDPECQQFIAKWIQDRRCPPGFADYLAEHDAGGPANAAWWAEREPDRLYELGLREHTTESDDLWCGPMPRLVDDTIELNKWVIERHVGKWTWRGTYAGSLTAAYDYPGSFSIYSPTVQDAIIDMLDSCRDNEFDPAKNMKDGIKV